MAIRIVDGGDTLTVADPVLSDVIRWLARDQHAIPIYVLGIFVWFQKNACDLANVNKLWSNRKGTSVAIEKTSTDTIDLNQLTA